MNTNSDEKPSTSILFLVKFFKNKKYADEFIKGKIHFNRLSYFKNLENEIDSERPDNNEAISHWLQPKGLIIKFNAPGIGEIEITEKDLAGPISMSIENHEHLHVFCMHAIRLIGFKMENRDIDCEQHQIKEVESQIKIDERNFAFGEYAVIARASEFLFRLKSTLNLTGNYFIGKSVEYYDEKTFNGEIPKKDIPFWKQSKFKHQNEFRICINTKTKGTNPIDVDMGSISDISALVETKNINNLFKIQTNKN